MNYREITIDDYEKLIPFWKEHYFVGEMDDKDRFMLFLDKNPGLSILAQDNGVIIGTALGSFDGRRGYIQKLVVDTTQRKSGVGRELIKQVIAKLQALGTTYIPIAVESDLVVFYEKCGFKTTTQVPMNIQL